MSKKPESVFRHTKVDKFLKTLKHTVKFSIQQQSKCGDPDMILCCRGLFIALELKSRGGKASQLQEYKLDLIRQKGHGIALVVTPDNWDNVKQLIERIDSHGKE